MHLSPKSLRVPALSSRSYPKSVYSDLLISVFGHTTCDVMSLFYYFVVLFD